MLNFLGLGIWILLLLLTLPVAVMHCIAQTYSRDGFLMPVLFAFATPIIYLSWDKQRRAPNLKGWILIALAAATGILGILQWAGINPIVRINFSVAAFVFVVCSWLVSQRSARYPRYSLVGFSAFLVVWLMVPFSSTWNLPARLFTWNGSLAGQLLDALQISNRTYAGQFQLIGKSWAMSSIVADEFSASTLMGVASLWIAFRLRSYLLFPVYLATALLWSVLGDTSRLVATSLMHEWYGQDWSSGWRSIAIGCCGLFTGVLLFLSNDKLLRVLFQPTDSDNSNGVNPLVRIWNGCFHSMGANLATSSKGSITNTKSGARS